MLTTRAVAEPLTERLFANARYSEMLALRACCRVLGATISQRFSVEYAKNPLLPRTSWIKMNECMACKAQGLMSGFKRFDGSHVVFCHNRVQCRVRAFICATMKPVSGCGGNLVLPPNREWNGHPVKVKRSNGVVESDWMIITVDGGQWMWSRARNDFKFLVAHTSKELEKWCWMSDLLSANDGCIALPAAELLWHTPYSLGCAQTPIVEEVANKAAAYKMKLIAHCSLPTCVHHTGMIVD